MVGEGPAILLIPGLASSADVWESTARNTDTPQTAPASFDPMLMAKGMANNESWHQRIVNDMFRSDGMTSGRVMGELMHSVVTVL